MNDHTSIIQQTLQQMGEVGVLLHRMGAAEGAAGNMSVGFRRAPKFEALYPLTRSVEMPFKAEDMAGFGFLATGSGCRLRDVLASPAVNVGAFVVNPGGETGTLYTAAEAGFTRLTSEFNTHLAFHRAKLTDESSPVNYLVHAHPPKTTFLSHFERYQNVEFLNRHLLRWEPETLCHFPHGIGIASFRAPGTMRLTEETLRALSGHEFVIWSRHGAVARSPKSLMHAFDMIEYIETAANYEYLNLSLGEESGGISVEEILDYAQSAGIQQTVF